jgi:hypothetical protein
MAYASLSLKAGLRNHAIILCLFQSGVRPGCLCRWTYRLIREYLYPEVKVPVKLVITSETDTKLQSYGLDYYITFLQRDAAVALRSYLDNRIGQGWRFKDDDPVFVTESTASRGEPLKTANIWEVIKQVAPAAGIDSRGMWSRLLRKTFRKVLNDSKIDEDTKEAIMGHKLPGSRGNYFDSHDHDEIAGKYMRCQFGRSTSGSSDEAAKKAVMAVMKAQYGDRITADKMNELERILSTPAVTVDQVAELARMVVEGEKAEKRGSKASKSAHSVGASLAAPFETRIVDEQALLALLDGGWDVVRELADRRIIVRRPNGVGG